MTATEDLLDGNRRYADTFEHGALASPPSKRVAIVTCMDARIETGRMLGLAEGEAHVIRNAGGILSEDALRSLVISQHLLGTEEIVLIQHTGCGMLTFTDAEFGERIEKATGHKPSFAAGTFADLEGNVRESVARLRAEPLLAHRSAVRGFVYEVETGRLTEVT